MGSVVITADFFHPESEMLLWKKTKHNDNNSRKYFGNGGIKMKILNHQIQYQVVEKKVNNYNKQIPEKLRISPQIRAAENYVFI